MGFCPWGSPGKNSAVGCHSPLQGIFPMWGSHSGLLQCRQVLCCLCYRPCLPYMEEYDDALINDSEFSYIFILIGALQRNRINTKSILWTMVKELAHVMVQPGRSDKILQGMSETCGFAKTKGFISHLNPRPWGPGEGNVSVQVWTWERSWYSNLKASHSKNSYMVDGQPLSSTHVFGCLMEDSLLSSVSWCYRHPRTPSQTHPE